MLLDLLAYFIIPIYTTLFAYGTNWFGTNFSVIGNLNGRKLAFLLWGILILFYFLTSLKQILPFIPRSKKEEVLSILAAVLLTFAVTTPYLPEQFPLHSFLHIIFAFSASVLLILCLFRIVWKLWRLAPSIYQPYLIGISALTGGCALLLFAAGIVSSALEIFFTITASLLIRALHKKLHQTPPS